MIQLQKHKIGDTLMLSGVYKVGGSPSSLTGYVVRSQVRKHSDLISDFTVTIPTQSNPANVGKFVLQIDSTETSTWTPGLYVCDIEFSVDGVIRSTETFEIPVIEDVTKPVVV